MIKNRKIKREIKTKKEVEDQRTKNTQKDLEATVEIRTMKNRHQKAQKKIKVQP